MDVNYAPYYNIHMHEQVQLSLIFIGVITGVISSAYLYQSSQIFINLLRKPLQLISAGMLTITSGVLLAAFISFESQFGVTFFFYSIPISALFYILYIVGSVLILAGARQFVYQQVK